MPEALSLKQFVAQQLESGRYQSYEEMVQAGLRLLPEREQGMIALLRNCVLLPSASNGVKQVFLFDAEDIIRRGMQRLITPHNAS